MAENTNNVPDVAKSNPVIAVPSSRVQTTIGSTSTQPLMVSVPVNHNGKPEKFTGLNFKTWQQKNVVLLNNIESCEISERGSSYC